MVVLWRFKNDSEGPQPGLRRIFIIMPKTQYHIVTVSMDQQKIARHIPVTPAHQVHDLSSTLNLVSIALMGNAEGGMAAWLTCGQVAPSSVQQPSRA